jgi:hypothetical protein
MNTILLTATLVALARAQDACVPRDEAGSPDARLGQLAGDMVGALDCPPGAERQKQELKRLAALDPGTRALRFFASPTRVGCSSVTYKFREVRAAPGDAVYFDMPEKLRDRAVAFVDIGHRQDPNEPNNARLGPEDWDSKPGLTSFQAYSSSYEGADAWRYWAGPASGKRGAKFAEIRGHSNPEMDALYEWRHYGHRGLGSGSNERGPLKAQAVRLVSTGADDVLLSELTVKVQPPPAERYLAATFSKGTELGDPETAHGRHYGGGQGMMGRYPGALVLGLHSRHGPDFLPEGWRYENGDLHVPLPKGARLTTVDVACGDSHPDGVRNKDGGWGSLGGSKLTIKVTHADGTSDTLMNRENVPPLGVLSGDPCSCDEPARAGDEVVFHADSDLSYLMGLRIGLSGGPE